MKLGDFLPRGLVLEISTRADGDGNYYFQSLGGRELNQKREDNRKCYFQKLGVDAGQVVSASLVHGTQVRVVGLSEAGQIVLGTDALVTHIPGIFLSLTVADCLPVFFYETQTKTVGLAHAGWRGIVGDIVPKTVKQLRSLLENNFANLKAVIGPGIGPCHFEVGIEVAEQFSKYPAAVQKKDGKIFVDLKSVVRDQLITSGLRPENIEISPDCTFCNPDQYFSFRRDKPQYLETMICVIGFQ